MNDIFGIHMRLGAVIATSLLALATFLALSPIILFSHSSIDNQLTSEDLTQLQRDELERGPFSSPGEEEGISITGAVLYEGSLLIAGEFEGEQILASHHLESTGSSDLVVARLDPNGTWAWIVSFGGEGFDKSVTLEKIDDRISVRGAIYGEVEFGDWTIGDDDKNGHQAFVADISVEDGGWRTAQIDPYGDLSSDPALWCGW